MSTQNKRSEKAQIIWNSTDSNSITPTMVGSLFYDINAEKLERDNSNAVYQTYDTSYTKVAAINPTTKKASLVDRYNFNYIQLDTSAVNTYDVGKFYWNETKGTYDFGLKNNVTLQLGQEQNVYGKAFLAITNGQLVMYRTSQGGHILFEPANFTQLSNNPDLLIGVATQDIALNEFGYITTFGEVNTLDTSAFVEGDTLYFGSSDIITNVKPSSIYFIIGRVNRSHATQGSIFVKTHFEALQTKQDKLSSYDESIIIEEGGNIEGNISLFQEYFEQKICELNSTPIQIIGVYLNGIKQKPSSYLITLPKTISVTNFSSGDYIEIQYTKLKN